VEKLLTNNKPRHFQTDLGKEFYNSHVKSVLNKNKINHYSVFSQYKAPHVERFNRTLRERINKYTTREGNKKWVSVLPSIVHSYNTSKHSALKGLRPVDVNEENEYNLWLNQNIDKIKKKKPQHKVGDNVRISKISASPFIKNFDNNWSDEVFKIQKVDTSQSPVMYVLHDLNDEIIQGKFYEPELQVIDTPSTFRIQSILRTKGKGEHKQYYVKWHGYKDPTWISKTDIM
jgi:L-rhamnose mutarotase